MYKKVDRIINHALYLSNISNPLRINMKTEVIMKRELFGCEISQKSKCEMFSATDLVRAGNKWRLTNGQDVFDMKKWFQLKGTKEFISELESVYGKVKISGNGRGRHTWVHPLLFIDMALAISPKLKVQTYQWIYDSLLRHRNDSGTSYTKMAGALYVHESNKSLFQGRIKLLANQIKAICKVVDWQKADENQLQLRDKIHNNITLLANVMRHNDKAIEFGIREALKNEMV